VDDWQVGPDVKGSCMARTRGKLMQPAQQSHDTRDCPFGHDRAPGAATDDPGGKV
jgi:hypothetical protein